MYSLPILFFRRHAETTNGGCFNQPSIPGDVAWSNTSFRCLQNLENRESHVRLQKWQLLCIKNSMLWKRIDDGDDGLQLVLPSKLQACAIHDLHEGAVGGHLGEEVLSRLRLARMCRAASNWCKSCLTCATRKMTVPKRKAYLQSIQSGYPMQLVSIDILDPLPVTEEGNKYVLAAVDHFTRWVETFRRISNLESRSYNNC